MRALEFIRDHVTFKLPYDFSYQMKTPFISKGNYSVFNSFKKTNLKMLIFALLGQKFLVPFLSKLKTPKSPLEIMWPFYTYEYHVVHELKRSFNMCAKKQRSGLFFSLQKVWKLERSTNFCYTHWNIKKNVVIFSYSFYLVQGLILLCLLLRMLDQSNIPSLYLYLIQKCP